jgi:hypothetical protein
VAPVRLLGIALISAAVLTSLFLVHNQSLLAAAPVPCGAVLHIKAANPIGGSTRTLGRIVEVTGAGIVGTFTATLGDLPAVTGTLTGTQDIRLNTQTNQAVSNGQVVAAVPGGSFDIDFEAQFDRNSGTVNGHGNVTGSVGPVEVRTSGSYSGNSVATFEYSAEIHSLCHIR